MFIGHIPQILANFVDFINVAITIHCLSNNDKFRHIQQKLDKMSNRTEVDSLELKLQSFKLVEDLTIQYTRIM